MSCCQHTWQCDICVSHTDVVLTTRYCIPQKWITVLRHYSSPFDPRCESVTFNRCNADTSVPEFLRATGPRDEGVQVHDTGSVLSEIFRIKHLNGLHKRLVVKWLSKDTHQSNICSSKERYTTFLDNIMILPWQRGNIYHIPRQHHNVALAQRGTCDLLPRGSL